MSEYRQLLMFTLSIKGPSTLCALSKLCIVGRIKKLRGFATIPKVGGGRVGL